MDNTEKKKTAQSPGSRPWKLVSSHRRALGGPSPPPAPEEQDPGRALWQAGWQMEKQGKLKQKSFFGKINKTDKNEKKLVRMMKKRNSDRQHQKEPTDGGQGS